MKTIVVPVDLSITTREVCTAACALVRLVRARLVLLHVVPLTPVLLNDIAYTDSIALASAVTATEKATARKLLAWSRRCTKKGLKVQAMRQNGQVIAEILTWALSTKANYIVMGSHGHGAAYELVVGSTTHGVLRKTKCPVLVVPVTR